MIDIVKEKFIILRQLELILNSYNSESVLHFQINRQGPRFDVD